MKKLYINLEKMKTILSLEEKINSMKREISDCYQKKDIEQLNCTHNLVLFYGPNPWETNFKGVSYQCLECEKYYESDKGDTFDFIDSTVIDVSNHNNLNEYYNGKKQIFNEVRKSLLENCDLTVQEFCKIYEKKY